MQRERSRHQDHVSCVSICTKRPERANPRARGREEGGERLPAGAGLLLGRWRCFDANRVTGAPAVAWDVGGRAASELRLREAVVFKVFPRDAVLALIHSISRGTAVSSCRGSEDAPHLPPL